MGKTGKGKRIYPQEETATEFIGNESQQAKHQKEFNGRYPPTDGMSEIKIEAKLTATHLKNPHHMTSATSSITWKRRRRRYRLLGGLDQVEFWGF